MKRAKVRVKTQRYESGAVEVTLLGENGQPVCTTRVERQRALDTRGTDAYAVQHATRVNDGVPHQRRFTGASDVVRVPRAQA